MNEYFERFMIWIPDYFAAPARITLIVILALIALRAIHRVMLSAADTGRNATTQLTPARGEDKP